MAAFFGADPCVPVPPNGADPLTGCSIESIYRAEAHHRGLWATYPAEKMKQSLALRRSRVPPAPPQCFDGPTMYRPAAPACAVEPVSAEVCPTPGECCATPNNSAVQQAQLGRPGVAR
ncbi:hypothetical protein [Rosistilla ulvae]|nr:hypothetical protein [Rosistilla ulvae]